MRALQEIERRLDDRELEPQLARQLAAGLIGAEVQQLQHELGDQILRQSGLRQRRRDARVQGGGAV